MVEPHVLSHQNFIYARLQGIIWQRNGLSSPQVLQENATEGLASLIKKADKPVVLDCKDVVRIDDYALEPVLKALCEASSELIIINGEGIEEQLFNLVHGQVGYNSIRPGRYGTARIGNTGEVDTESLESEVKTVTEGNIERIVRDCYEAFEDGERRLHSTPVKASGLFDASEIIAVPEDFAFLSFYVADEVQAHIQDGEIDNPKLLAVSLRGSPFATSASLLLDYKVEIIDHVGPIHKVFYDHGASDEETNVEYVYVGDFMIGSTEFKIAQAYARYRNRKLRRAVVLGSALPPSEYGYGNQPKVKPLVLLQDVCNSVSYSFI